MKTLILLSGIPGSGKSTWAKTYLNEHPNTKIVSSDGIRVRLFGSRQAFNDERLVWRTYLEDIHAYAREGNDVTVIADSTNLTNHYRRYYFRETPEFDRHILVVFEAPFALCELRNKQRESGKIVSDEGMEKLEAEWEDPSEDAVSLYDECIRIKD
ncbi:MAG: ATP-binding protein [Bacilli bacterium]|nr:ATP-binding protein [Bacilli bacterium]